MLSKIKKIGLGMAALAMFVMAGVNNVSAAPVDYASTTQAVQDATSGLLPVLIQGSLIVIGIALGIWALFFLIGKLRKHTR